MRESADSNFNSNNCRWFVSSYRKTLLEGGRYEYKYSNMGSSIETGGTTLIAILQSEHSWRWKYVKFR